MKVYFDNAATTAMNKEVINAMLPYMQQHHGNPSSVHGYGRETRTAIEEARKTIAGHLHVSPSEIFFTSGGTEANNTALFCAVRDLGIKHIISSKIQHHCVTHALDRLLKDNSVTVHYVNLLPDGHIDLEHLEVLLSDNSENCLVTLMHGNNEIGNLTSLKKVSAICEQYNVLFHSDTVQTISHYHIDLSKIKIHFIAGSAHKFHGPKGVGFLYIHPDIKIDPFLYGGSQERNMRAGTENVYGIVGMAKAMDLAYQSMDEDFVYVQGIKDYMITRLKESIEGISFNGDAEGKSMCTILSVLFPYHKASEMFLYNLDIAGIAISAGSACTSGAGVGSHVLDALKIDQSVPTIRFSFSKYNTKEEVDFVVEKLKEMYVAELV